MNGPIDSGSVLGGISIVVTLLLGLLVFITNQRANKTSDKKLSLEEQAEAYDQHDAIATRRKEELDRVYKRLEALELTVAELQKRDVQKQKTIDDQANELVRTNRVLTAVRHLFVQYAARVEKAWADGHPMPTLTPQEKSVLEDTLTVGGIESVLWNRNL